MRLRTAAGCGLSASTCCRVIVCSGFPASAVPASTAVQPPGIWSPLIGSPLIGSPLIGRPLMGSPLIGSPLIGSPLIGSPLIGSPLIGSPLIGQPVDGQAVDGQPVDRQPVDRRRCHPVLRRREGTQGDGRDRVVRARHADVRTAREVRRHARLRAEVVRKRGGVDHDVVAGRAAVVRVLSPGDRQVLAAARRAVGEREDLRDVLAGAGELAGERVNGVGEWLSASIRESRRQRPVRVVRGRPDGQRALRRISRNGERKALSDLGRGDPGARARRRHRRRSVGPVEAERHEREGELAEVPSRAVVRVTGAQVADARPVRLAHGRGQRGAAAEPPDGPVLRAGGGEVDVLVHGLREGRGQRADHRRGKQFENPDVSTAVVSVAVAVMNAWPGPVGMENVN